MKISVIVVLILLTFFQLEAQNLSTLVLPSEDELVEALRLGEIDHREFLILLDIIEHSHEQLDSKLIDLIPNLSYFLRFRTDRLSSLARDQEKIFRPKIEPLRGQPKIIFHHRYYRRAEETSASKYRSKLLVQVNDNIRFHLKVQREENGTERLTGRGLVYKSKSGKIRELIIGNFSKRIGLGTLFGYRGKLFDFSDELNRESLLYPDFGGFNGFYLKSLLDNQMIQLLVSVNRDANHNLLTGGGQWSLLGRSFTPSLTVGLSRLSNRSTDSSLTDFKFALGTKYRYSRGYFETELAAQSNQRKSDLAIVAEGSHHFDPSALNYAVWWYGDDYNDLTSGSKAAAIYHALDLTALDFSYSSKRSGQKGVLVKTITYLSARTKLENSILLAGYNKDSVNLQFLPAIERKIGNRNSVRIDYLNRVKRRLFAFSVDRQVKQRWRLEGRFHSGNLRIRSYIAYTDDESDARYWSLFSHLRLSSEKSGLAELWFNLGRVSTGTPAVDYWYGFARSARAISPDIELGVKVMHRFERGSIDKHQTTFMFELKAILF